VRLIFSTKKTSKTKSILIKRAKTPSFCEFTKLDILAFWKKMKSNIQKNLLHNFISQRNFKNGNKTQFFLQKFKKISKHQKVSNSCL